MNSLTVWPKIAAALLAVSVLAGPAHAQSDLGTRLDEAGQKLDSDMQSCRPVNLAEYAQLLQEASRNKKLAQKAAKAGAPPNPQVDADLGKAMMLFARAQAAQAMQCMQNAQQQRAQPQPQTQSTPQQTGMAPSTPSRWSPQGVTADDAASIARQQRTIADFEEDLAELESLVKAGKCQDTWNLVDDLDDELDYLDTPAAIVQASTGHPKPRVPGSLIDRWDDRIDELIKGCPRPGMLDYKQVGAILEITNFERAKYGLKPLRWSFKLEQHAHAYANELKLTGEMKHAPREGRGDERENISQGLPWWSVQQHLENWRKEKAKFKPGIFPDVSFTGNWYEVGHWTQWIWARTVAIGCAMAIGGPASWLVCRYWPGGNKDGQPVGIPPLKVAEVDQPILPTGEVFTPNAPGGGTQSAGTDADSNNPEPLRNTFAYDRTMLEAVDTFPAGGVGNAFLHISNILNDDGEVERVTFYDPAFAGTPSAFDTVGDTGSFDTGSWRRGVRVASNPPDTDANATFQDTGVVGFFYTGQGETGIIRVDTSNNWIRPRPVGGDYGYEPPQSVNIGSTSDGGPIEYVRLVTLPVGSGFDPYQFYTGSFFSYNAIGAGVAAYAPQKATIDPVNQAFVQWAGYSFGQSSSVYGSDSVATPPAPTPKYGFNVGFGGGPDGAGNWQVGFQGFYNFGETPGVIYVDTKVEPPTLPSMETYAPVTPTRPLEIM